MKSLLRSNIYDVSDTIIIIGTCLKEMQKDGFDKLRNISNNIYELCLEESHINMAITKIAGMISTGKINRIIFASVNKSPHCVQLHYIKKELDRFMDLKNIQIVNYVVEDNKLIEINDDVISLSKNLVKLMDYMNK